jgi:hypothetical protein
MLRCGLIDVGPRVRHADHCGENQSRAGIPDWEMQPAGTCTVRLEKGDLEEGSVNTLLTA